MCCKAAVCNEYLCCCQSSALVRYNIIIYTYSMYIYFSLVLTVIAAIKDQLSEQ